MPNPFFRFKQFTVQQDACAMKVCTDACVFGAWAAPYSHTNEATHFLDIGTGTGLLSLMLAQRYTNTVIDAVEIDTAAATQAKENFEVSPWRNRLSMFKTDIQNFDAGKQYDFIISNPPFYKDSLKSPYDKRNTALHSAELSMPQLMLHINRLLKPGGSFALLLPYSRQKEVEAEAQHYSFKPVQQILVKQTPAHHYFRSMLLFQQHTELQNEKEIIIKDANGNYSAAFVQLLKDYYLIF